MILQALSEYDPRCQHVPLQRPREHAVSLSLLVLCIPLVHGRPPWLLKPETSTMDLATLHPGQHTGTQNLSNVRHRQAGDLEALIPQLEGGSYQGALPASPLSDPSLPE